MPPWTLPQKYVAGNVCKREKLHFNRTALTLTLTRRERGLAEKLQT